MYEFLRLLGATIVLRPYVFSFLAVYLIAGRLHMGWEKTLLYIPVGYALAWFSEYASIHWGFPYGDYFYIHTTLHKELWVLGVPFMDSLSYVFLSYCSYSLAVFLMSPVAIKSKNLITAETSQINRSKSVLFLGAFLFVLLDIIIDPVALQGRKWFLGLIYGYRHNGFYFGIPMSNFGGWLLVGLVLTAALQALDRIDSKLPQHDLAKTTASWFRLLGPLLYFCVLLFNISITFHIGAMLLGLVDLLLLATLAVPMFFFTIYKLSDPSSPFTSDLRSHSGKLARR
ncbi:MAG: carotenoid biosynthesis protein [Syntrophobacteraceae bacterium]